MARARYVENKSFDRHLRHPTKRTSLRNLGDKLRQVSDDIAETAQREIRREQARWEAKTEAIKHGKLDANAASPGQGYLRAKATTFALKSAADNTAAFMGSSEGQMTAFVVINRQGSASLEYGGEDSGVVLGQGSRQHPVHPAYAFLRRAADRI